MRRSRIGNFTGRPIFFLLDGVAFATMMKDQFRTSLSVMIARDLWVLAFDLFGIIGFFTRMWWVLCLVGGEIEWGSRGGRYGTWLLCALVFHFSSMS